MVTSTKRKDAKPEAAPPATVPPPPEVRMVPLDTIRLDGDTQRREKIDSAVLDDYAARIGAGDQFPPLEACEDPEGVLWLWDGFHRFLALERLRGDAVKVRVTKGTQADAQWLSLSANAKHGLRRTNAEKREAVEIALERRPELSNRAIADHVGVSDTYVGDIRATANEPQSTVRTGKDGRTIETAKIGRPDPEPESPPAELPRLIDRPDLADGPDDDDDEAYVAGRNAAPKLDLSHLAILEKGAAQVADLTAAVGHRCVLWTTAEGQYRALFDAHAFGNWDQGDLPPDDYSPSAEAVADAASRATGFAMTALDWGPAPGGLETMWGIDLKKGRPVAPAKPEGPPEVPTGEAGGPIPEKAVPAFALVEDFRALVKLVASCEAEAARLAALPGGSQLHMTSVRAHLKNAKDAIWMRRPYAACPYCGGAKKVCDACKGQGWVTKSTYNAAPPELRGDA